MHGKAAGQGAGKEPSRLPSLCNEGYHPWGFSLSSFHFSNRSPALSERGAAGQGGKPEVLASHSSF